MFRRVWIACTLFCQAIGWLSAADSPLIIEVLDPNPALLSETGEIVGAGTPELVDRFAGTLPPRGGVIADGTSLLLLRARTSNAVTFSLASAIGGLHAPGVTSPGSRSITVTPTPATDGALWAFAIYASPDDLAGAAVRKTIDVSAKDGVRIGHVSLRVEAPPVLLVHGVWSSSATWDGLREFLATRGFRFCESVECLVNYGATQPAPSFDPLAVELESQFAANKIIQATTNTLNALREQGIAAAQVDVVAHSLGGLLARARVALPDAERAYRRRENFGRGDFHKLITVGTPHQGTPIANFLIANRDVRSSFFDGATLEEYLASTGHPIGPAIEQMQTNSAALAHLGTTMGIPSHAIVGIAPPNSRTEELLNMLPAALGYFVSFDSLLGGNGAHDVLVPSRSQAGGLPRRAITIVHGTVHADLDGRDTGETESHAIWRRIARLLLGSSESKRFSNFTGVATNGAPLPQEPFRESQTTSIDSEH